MDGFFTDVEFLGDHSDILALAITAKNFTKRGGQLGQEFLPFLSTADNLARRLLVVIDGLEAFLGRYLQRSFAPQVRPDVRTPVNRIVRE